MEHNVGGRNVSACVWQALRYLRLRLPGLAYRKDLSNALFDYHLLAVERLRFENVVGSMETLQVVIRSWKMPCWSVLLNNSSLPCERNGVFSDT
jgi:hypothetical protein